MEWPQNSYQGYKQSHVGEVVLAAGLHELKVVVLVESTTGEAATQERESKRRKQESAPDPRVFVLFCAPLSL